MMNLDEFRTGLDYLFEQNRISEVEPYLEGALRTAIGENDDAAVIFILNEMIGYYRETCDYDRAIMYGEKALEILDGAEETGSVHYATTLLNLANALRAAGRLEESLDRYAKAEAIYDSLLVPEAFDFASLYNNESLVCQEAGMYEAAIDRLNRAMAIVKLYPEKRFELAVTHANLGNSMIGALQAGDPESRDPTVLEQIGDHLLKAVEIFHERNENGTHLAAALNGLGDLNSMKGDDGEAIRYYAEALDAIERNLGRIDYYYRVRDNLEAARQRLQNAQAGTGARKPDVLLTGLELCRAYYGEVIRPMIESSFPELTDKTCAGLFGEGSDAYGYDDVTSRDHDWGPGVILLINDRKTYDQYGQKLQDELLKKASEIKSFHGFKPDVSSIQKGRRGVFWTYDYVARITGIRLNDNICYSNESDPPVRPDADAVMEGGADAAIGVGPDEDELNRLTDELMNDAPQYALAALTNGEVFNDPEGSFTALRARLSKYYDGERRTAMLMQEAALFSQNAQYNYLRMKRRNDPLAADALLMEGLKNAARIRYCLAGRFLPHDKWTFRGLRDLDADVYNKVRRAYEQAACLSFEDPTDAQMRPVMTEIDALSIALQEVMVRQGLISVPKRYMEDVIMELNKNELVKRVVEDEWKAFDKVINEGGRADCQDNFPTFNIMRSSQYLTWDADMLLRYAEDFEASVAAGWNPIMEKYGRMEESTAPHKYAEIKDSLPAIDDDKRAIIEEIVGVQVGWMEEFAGEYPGMAGNARSIHTAEDTEFDTSYETYLRGELMTYSDEMLGMYGAFIVRLAREGRNLTYMTMENTARLYGYKSLDDAESALQGE